jgi:site-specific DNA recombinase
LTVKQIRATIKVEVPSMPKLRRGRSDPDLSRESLRVAIYLRVSSDEQAKEGYSLETQERLCREELDRVIGPNLYEATVYRDDGFKGTWGLYDPANPRKKFRPALTQMQKAFRAGSHDVLCIYRVNRLWRRSAVADFLTESFMSHGLKRVICVREHVDISSASGRFHLNLASATGQFEVEQLGEYISDALRQRMRDGFLHRPCYGWRWQRDEEMAPGQRRRGVTRDPEQGEQVQWMVRQYLAGKGLRSITRELNERGVPTSRGGKRWTRVAAGGVIGNPAHAGLVEVDGEYIEGQHLEERYYDADTFYQVKAALERYAGSHPGKLKVPEYLLGGIIRCGHCGGLLSCQRVTSSNRRYYRCHQGAERGFSVCTANAKPADLVETAVLTQIRQIVESGQTLADAQRMLDALVEQESRDLEREVERLEKQLLDLRERYKYWSEERRLEHITPEEYQIHREDFSAQNTEVAAKLEATKQRLASHEQRQAELRHARKLLRSFDDSFDALDHEQQREIMQFLVADAQMFHEDDGTTRLAFTIRCEGQFGRVIPRLTGRRGTREGSPQMTMAQMEVYALWAEGLRRSEIARRLHKVPENVSQLLWLGQHRMQAATREEAYERAREDIEASRDFLFAERKRRRRAPDGNRPVLTDQQRRVLSLTAKGMTAQQIAEKLAIPSVNTVYVHLEHCRGRLGTTTTEEAVKHARAMGYI